MDATPAQERSTPFWRDERFLNVFFQVLVFGIVIWAIYTLVNNLLTRLEAQDIPLSFGFLQIESQFDISQTLIEYSRTSTYARAYLVGIINTLVVAFWGVIFATLLGIVIGVSRLSTNWLVSRLAMGYIEVLRNIPLLVLLIFWHRGFFLQLPGVRDAIRLGPMFFSQRGVSMPWGIPTDTFDTWLYIAGIGIVAAIVVGYYLTQQGKRTGRMPLVTVWSLATFLVIALIGWIVLPQSPLTLDLPDLPETGFNIQGGNTLSAEFMALLSGLVIYTSAFIGEVVRAGIQSVSKGQVEASRALGLTGFQTLRLVVFPQAMRVIIPPLTSQYLNLTKNSSLATAIGYPDIVQVYNTTINQSGRAVEMTVIMMSTYLTFSLITSAILNWYNKRIRLVER
jgi:general L-amino acid transport system permease protein